jgi:hypothetical protein
MLADAQELMIMSQKKDAAWLCSQAFNMWNVG